MHDIREDSYDKETDNERSLRKIWAGYTCIVREERGGMDGLGECLDQREREIVLFWRM